ncbi:phage replisome organizer N-terminal domain-containing protein [Lentibacillus sp. N15]|uniref:phage replisome organizer N-terminal domain-containing protein n=1 Tax=Lentibacillus songyuanensis TaxID=3136161 RepID=UPI0031BB7AC9
MGNIKWIKLSTNMFEDEKIRLIEKMPDADTILIIWVKLLSQAGKTNASGYIYLSENIPYTDEMLATIFNRPVSTVRLALKTFEQFGMISIDDEHFIAIENWEKHQNVEGMERIRKQTRERVKRHRERKKLEENGDVTLPVTEGNATEEELELEEELDKERDKDKPDNRIRDLFNHYLSKNIIKHKKMTSPMRTAANARLRDYPYEQLIQAIDNYAVVYQGKEYWFSTKYGFADLMRDKDIRKFIDDADPLNNFLERGFKNNGVHGHRNGHAGSASAGTSYEQAMRELDAAKRAVGR